MRPAIAIALMMIACTTNARCGEAVVRETTLDIPTYQMGPPDKTPPLGNEKVYPYAMQTSVTERKATRSYRAVILENDYLQVIILPELGGKIYAAHDKTNANCDFIYRNHVIKPGLVALRGAWTSGGIEWNFPTRGHTVNTFSPVPFATRRNPDGSVTCVVGTTEWVRRMEWSVAITVHPDRTYFHNRMLVMNPTLTHQRAYFWANAAVHAWSDTQVTFPPTDHTFAGMRRTPEPWPINNGRDVSRYTNIPFPHDFFCGTPGDFQGVYHHEHDLGTVHCAAWHDSFGRKFWTWGTAPSGQIWEGILTDKDGPYIEVQSGRLLTQGDTWMFEPHMQESFEEYWYPVKKLGSLVKAGRDAALGLTRNGNQLRVAIQTTGDFANCSVEIKAGGKTASFTKVRFQAVETWHQEVGGLAADAQVERITVCNDRGRVLLAYEPQTKPLPAPELEPDFPTQLDEKASAEEVYLKGYYTLKHWKQREAVALFEESLQRDPGYTPALRALAILAYQAGRYQDACDLCDRVLRRNDDDETARYYRALAKIALGMDSRTEMDLYTVGRRSAYRHTAPYLLASLAVEKGDLARAEELLRQACDENSNDLKAKIALAAVLRHAGEKAASSRLVDSVLTHHPINRLAIVERAILGGKEDLAILCDDPQCYLETACDYLELNLRDDAAAVLELFQKRPGASKLPLVEFYLGYLADRHGQPEAAKGHYQKGVAMPIVGVFPFRNEEAAVLRTGLHYLPGHWKLHALLGILLVAKDQPAAGREQLNLAVKASADDPAVFRVLGTVAWREFNDTAQAQASFEKAVALDPDDPGHYVALDSLYAAQGRQAERARLFAHVPPAIHVDHRVLLREATYHVDIGQFDRGLAILHGHKFHVWEGKSEAQELFIRALNTRADEHRKAGRYAQAIEDLHQALEYPVNLGAGKPFAPNYVREYYKLGLCYRGLGQAELARQHFNKAVECPVDLVREDPECRQKAAQELQAK